MATFRKKRRIVKSETEPNTYYDLKTGLQIWQRWTAAEYGVSNWVVSDSNEKELWCGSFMDCKYFIYKNYSD